MIDFFRLKPYTGNMDFKKKDLLTIPNILTYIRFLLVPVFVIVYFKEDLAHSNLWAIGVAALSALTDVVDGKIARKFNQITDIGKILDPIADKAMEFAIMFCIVATYPPVISLIILFAVKEIVTLFFSTYLLRLGHEIWGAKWCGKVCTVLIYGVSLIFLVFPKIPHPVDLILIAIVGAGMILAFVVYMVTYIKMIKEIKSGQDAGSEEKDNAGNGSADGSAAV